MERSFRLKSTRLILTELFFIICSEATVYIRKCVHLSVGRSFGFSIDPSRQSVTSYFHGQLGATHAVYTV